MLVLTRRVKEKIVIDGNVTIVIQRISGNRVTVGIEAPDHVRIVRGELERVVNDFAVELDEPVLEGEPQPIGAGI